MSNLAEQKKIILPYLQAWPSSLTALRLTRTTQMLSTTSAENREQYCVTLLTDTRSPRDAFSFESVTLRLRSSLKAIE